MISICYGHITRFIDALIAILNNKNNIYIKSHYILTYLP
ncbi:hypothetical protein VIBNISOn1_350001 [Vibrio nigripulchritudo SOn1]|uniref:Uncharacterized protein n=1 Tax=Vibrio nigripulchritudo SOn1 TaxID=1238450 RepID=A0AAV2VSY8_9VIBR|nr:hypothetical protein VIBNISOn1_350001 [Vibrio nigripulchritudo SOn1]